MKEESFIMTRQAVAVGVGLFLVLSTVGYIVFPVIFQGQIDALSHQLESHTGIDAHMKQTNRNAMIESRVIAMEAAMLRLDPGFKIIPPFVVTDTLFVAMPDTLAADSLK